MPEEWQTRGRIEELAILTRAVGAGRITLEAMEDDDAFSALCKMGATVRTESSKVHKTVYRTETAHLRLLRVQIEIRRSAEQTTPEPNAKAA